VEWGSSNNPDVLFCVHGLTRNGRDFDHLAQVLAKDYRVICPDVPGRGKSAWLEDKTAYHYGTYVADMVALINALGIAKLDWVGTSMGGLIGMTIAAFHPGLIQQLVLNDIGPFVPGAALRRIGKYVGKAPSFADAEEAEAYMRMIFSPFGISQDVHWQHMVQHGVEQTEEGKLRLAYDPAIAEVFATKDMQDIDLWALWEKIGGRALTLRGAESDILLPATAHRMGQEGPKATLVEFPGVGHAPALMEPLQIAVVQNWLLDV
jgi:pimeloyl-ACP methyl ester carboxylesterase